MMELTERGAADLARAARAATLPTAVAAENTNQAMRELFTAPDRVAEKKTNFLEIFNRCVTRHGHDKLLAYLENETDFFVAPASTKYHGTRAGGLVEHSLNVYNRLMDFAIRDTLEGGHCDVWPEYEETVAIIALLHDVCKANCYIAGTQRRRNADSGKWEDYQGYSFHDPLPLGHGEKSLFLIQQHMALTAEEAMAIRWHMGAYDNAVKGGSSAMGEAMNLSPWVWRLQEADMCAAWIDEKEDKPE